MASRTTGDPSLAQQLLDLQVSHHLEQLDEEHLAATVSGLADDLLAASGSRPIADLVDPEAVKPIVHRALATGPGSAAVGGIVELAVDVLLAGPPEPYPLGDLVDRERVETVVDELLALHPLVERSLGRLSKSPLVGTVASRFMGRVVGEVLQANKAVADKVPGLGTLMSFGTSAASRVVGAADKQFEGLIGDTVGKGGAFAVRRLNAILIETLKDPTTREAVLQVWDLASAEQVRGLGDRTSREELSGVVDAVHSLVVDVAATEHAARLADALVDAFFDHFGGYTPEELLDELDIDRDEVVADLVRIAPGVVAALRESGDLERVIRDRLAPFYDSAEVRALLG